jgi:hypothetical protein
MKYGSVAKFIFDPFSARHDVMKSLEIGHLVKIIKHCFEGGFRNGTIVTVQKERTVAAHHSIQTVKEEAAEVGGRRELADVLDVALPT